MCGRPLFCKGRFHIYDPVWVWCCHVSGLFARYMTAGPDEIRRSQSPIKITLINEHGCGRGVWFLISTHRVIIMYCDLAKSAVAF